MDPQSRLDAPGGAPLCDHARSGYPRFTMRADMAGAIGLTLLALLPRAQAGSSIATLSIVGTSDLHGAAFPRNGVGGLALLAGYVNNLRAARAADGGAVLLVDSGDTFQGDIESNLSEGALVEDAYNAMGYTAEAIGNHDFDFGSVDTSGARQTAGDLRGAIKARATQAHHPFLAANLIDVATGRPVEWPNVEPSALVQAAGVKVGVIGVVTIDALQSTLAANVQGMRIAALEPVIAADAERLRAAGAQVVIVAAHAGGRCDRFDDPMDLSSCDQGGEIFRVASSLPRGVVDVIAAGHTHAGIAHEVNGIAIVEPFSRGQAFGRVDIEFDRQADRVRAVHVFAPRAVCSRQDPATGNCAAGADESVPASYEGRVVVPDAAVESAMQPALDVVHKLEATTLGVTLSAPVLRGGASSSPLGSLFADAIRSAVPGADVAVINSSTRGLWADLPAGPLTFGRLYSVFPFDNRVARITLTRGELGQWIASEIRQGRAGALGISGAHARASCVDGQLHVDVLRDSRAAGDQDRLLVVTIGGPTLSGNVATADPLAGGPAENGPVVREAAEDWFKFAEHVTPARVAEAGQRIDVAAARADRCASVSMVSPVS